MIFERTQMYSYYIPNLLSTSGRLYIYISFKGAHKRKEPIKGNTGFPWEATADSHRSSELLALNAASSINMMSI